MCSRAIASLLLLAAFADGDDPPVRVVAGRAHEFELAADENFIAFRVAVPSGTRRLLAIVSAESDVDLAVATQRLDLERIEEAEARATTSRTVDRILYRPAGAEELFVFVYRSWGDTPAVRAELFVQADRAGDEMLAGGARERIHGAAERVFFVPRYAIDCVFTAEGKSGPPRLRLKRGDATIEARPRGNGVALRRKLAPGFWRVLLEPSGESPEMAVEAERLAPAAWLEESLGGERPALEGARAERTVELTDDDFFAFFDVDEATGSVVVETTMTDPDHEVYVSRFAFPDSEEAIFDYGEWGVGASKKLVVGGTGPLPLGRYWLVVHPIASDEDRLTLRLTRRPGPALAALPTRTGLAVGKPRRVTFEATSGRAGFALPFAPRGVHLQLFEAPIDIDLVLVREDTGMVMERALTLLQDEYMVVSDELVLPPDTRVRVDACRWIPGDDETGGVLHVHPRRRPLPPRSYLPPYDVWRGEGRPRALAATVALSADNGGGTGIVVTPTGLVLTAQHVVEDTEEVVIGFPYNRHGQIRQVYAGQVVAEDAKLDLALVRPLVDLWDRALSPRIPHVFVPLGSAAKLSLGDSLEILGYPAAAASRSGEHLTFLSGRVSAFEPGPRGLRWLITDARIGPGNSGGAAFDARFVAVAICSEGGGAEEFGFFRPIERLPAAWRARIRGEGGTVAD